MQHLKWLDPERDTNLVGSRLVTRLLSAGYKVRACGRSVQKLQQQKLGTTHSISYSSRLWTVREVTAIGKLNTELDHNGAAPENRRSSMILQTLRNFPTSHGYYEIEQYTKLEPEQNRHKNGASRT